MTNGQKIALGLGGVAIVAVAAGIYLSRTGDDDKDLTLAMNGATCVVTTTGAAKDFHVGKGHKATYHVKNTCTSDQLLLVGNFRPVEGDGGVVDCKAGTVESTWPFKNAADQARRQVYVAAGETQPLILKDAKNDTQTPIRYFFDVCLGGKKVDPRLDVDP